jgi:hypothetical protein
MWRRNSQWKQFRFHQIPSSTWSQTPQDRPNTNILAMDTEEAMEGATCIVQEEIPQMDCLVEPTFLNSDMRHDQSSPNPLNLEKLELIFKMRSYMMEQLHWHTLISSIINMLFNAFSSMSVKEICPTCAQHFSLKPQEDTSHGDSSDGKFHCSKNPSNA